MFIRFLPTIPSDLRANSFLPMAETWGGVGALRYWLCFTSPVFRGLNAFADMEKRDGRH